MKYQVLNNRLPKFVAGLAVALACLVGGQSYAGDGAGTKGETFRGKSVDMSFERGITIRQIGEALKPCLVGKNGVLTKLYGEVFGESPDSVEFSTDGHIVYAAVSNTDPRTGQPKASQPPKDSQWGHSVKWTMQNGIDIGGEGGYTDMSNAAGISVYEAGFHPAQRTTSLLVSFPRVLVKSVVPGVKYRDSLANLNQDSPFVAETQLRTKWLKPIEVLKNSNGIDSDHSFDIEAYVTCVQGRLQKLK